MTSITQTMNAMSLRTKTDYLGLTTQKKATVGLVILAGVLLRFAVSMRGHNFDFDSYVVVAKANRGGITPWNTDRYNYGPIWWHLLRLFDFLTVKFSIGFRFQIITLLTVADLVIAYFIWTFSGLVRGCVFFLNPVSIIITGYHNQFDNLSIAIICMAILFLVEANSKKITSVDLVVVLLLGLSLSTKHVFAFFILWIVVRERSLQRRMFYLVLPPLLFIIGFVPYWSTSHEAIMRNVISYRSFNNAPVWHAIGLGDGLGPLSPFLLFVSSVAVIGYLTRNMRLVEHFFLYTVVLVVFTNALALQYLAIAAFGAVGLLNLGFIPFFLYATAWATTDVDGLHVDSSAVPFGELAAKHGADPVPFVLGLGLLMIGWYATKPSGSHRSGSNGRIQDDSPL